MHFVLYQVPKTVKKKQKKNGEPRLSLRIIKQILMLFLTFDHIFHIANLSLDVPK